jgi:hypothetical protein
VWSSAATANPWQGPTSCFPILMFIQTVTENGNSKLDDHWKLYVFLSSQLSWMHWSIQTLYSVLCWSTFGSDYSLESSWVMTLQA